ncbi:hypothetical protein J6590_079487 [Homalodisca vitripennis]|nr:hypothetical protein J6590_079487 [Homalodisca vitripennis]
MSKRVRSNSPVSEGTIINSLIDGGVQVQDELSDDFLQNLSDSDAENESDISVRASDDNESDVDDTDDDPDFILPSDNEELLDSEEDVAQISLPSTSTGRPRGRPRRNNLIGCPSDNINDGLSSRDSHRPRPSNLNAEQALSDVVWTPSIIAPYLNVANQIMTPAPNSIH